MALADRDGAATSASPSTTTVPPTRAAANTGRIGVRTHSSKGRLRASRPSSRRPSSNRRPTSSTSRPTETRRSRPVGSSVVPPSAPAPGGTPTPNRNEPDSVWPSTTLTVVQETSYTPVWFVVRSMTIRSSAVTRPAAVRPSGSRTAARESLVFSGSENVRTTCPGAVPSVDPGSGVDDTNPACASAVAGRATTAIAAATVAATRRLVMRPLCPGAMSAISPPRRSYGRPSASGEEPEEGGEELDPPSGDHQHAHQHQDRAARHLDRSPVAPEPSEQSSIPRDAECEEEERYAETEG